MGRLLRAIDDDIARWYDAYGIVGVRPRFSMALIRLHHLGPMTIRALAAEVDVTHSAMSQTVTSMRRDGLVEVVPGSDARTRDVSLTDAGRGLVPALEAEWRATERAIGEIEAEIPYALTRVIRDIEAALERRPFVDRLDALADRSALPESKPS